EADGGGGCAMFGAEGMLAGKCGVEELGIVSRGLVEPMVVGLDNAGTETVDQVGAVGDLDQIAVAMQQVMIARTGQGVGKGHQFGAARSPISSGGVPFGDSDFDVAGGSILAEEPADGSKAAFAFPEVGRVVVRADEIEISPGIAQGAGGGKGGKNADGRIGCFHRFAK